LAQLIHSRFICDGRYRVHAVEGVRRRKPRIIEIEVVDTGQRLHGSARWLDKLALGLVTRTGTSTDRAATASLAQLLAARTKRL
jgi:hypothetical protein